MVPVEPRGFGIGRIARVSGDGLVLGYFFAPAVFDWPSDAILEKLAARDATWIHQLSDLHLLDGSWPIRRSSEWRRAEWPIPGFVRRTANKARLVTYSDDLQTNVIRPISLKAAARYPADAASGAVAVEKVLTRILNDDVTDYIRQDLDGARAFIGRLR